MNAQSDSDEDDMPDASELLDFELIAKSQPERGWGLLVWVVLIVVVLGGAGGWLYLQGGPEKTQSAEGVPIIIASKTKLKERPVDPGGMKVPDRDKLVYGRMTGKVEAVGGVERLLPPPEMPMEPPQKAPQAPQTEAPQMKAPAAGMPTPLEKPLRVPRLKTSKAVKSPQPPLSIAQKPQPKSKVAARITPKTGYLIQLSAVRTEQAAKFEWARLIKKHADILGSLVPVIQRANLGTKGIFFRVRGGWFVKRAQAKAVCEELVRRNVGCILVRP